MSLGELLLPGLERSRRARLRLTAEALPPSTVPAPDRRLLRLDGGTETPEAGSEVEAGARLGTLFGLPVLAPFDANVAEARPVKFMLDRGAGSLLVLERRPEGKKAPSPLAALAEEASREEVLERLEALGVPAFGRDPLPLARLLGDDPEGRSPAAVVVLAADGEPLLSSESQLLRDRVGDASAALAVVARAAGTDRVVLAAAGELLPSVRRSLEGVEAVALGARYPETLPELAARRALGTGATGPVPVLTFESALAALAAVRKGVPTFERRLTVVGADARYRRNVVVSLGTPLAEVLRHAGFAVAPEDRVLTGGPMRGRSEVVLDASVDPSTTAVVVIPASAAEPLDNDPCIGCGSCIDACPMGLQPQELGRNAEFGLFARNAELDLDSCIRCGLCAWVCPSGRPLLQWIELTASELRAAGAEDRVA